MGKPQENFRRLLLDLNLQLDDVLHSADLLAEIVGAALEMSAKEPERFPIEQNIAAMLAQRLKAYQGSKVAR